MYQEKVKVIQNIICPAQLPDCNSIELLWDELDWEIINKLNRTSQCGKPFRKLGSQFLRILMELINRMSRICKML